jgi:MtN3 and saliva related transmembrane protein
MHHIPVILVESLFALALFANAALFIPQAWRIYKNRDGNGISLITFGGFFVTQLLTTLHAFVKDDMILFVGYILAMITCGSVIILALRYRKKS